MKANALGAVLGLIAVLGAASRSSRAQSISGVLVSAADGEPVAYGTVILGDSGRGRFADAAGRFVLAGLASGTYRMRARQIGFSPFDTTIAVGDAPVRVVFRLLPLALRLATVPVTARRSRKCVTTGIPDSAINPQLANVFSQLRDNVDRYRILLDEYPFHYRREEHRFLRTEGNNDSTETFDTVSYYSRDRRRYHVGDVLYEDVSVLGERQQYMYIPTFRDLADTAFQAAHCFSFAGQDHGTIRIDFQPASHISVPDVEGSIYLDALRYIVRRAVFRLTKPDAVVPPILGLTVTTTFDEIVPLVAVVGSTRSEEPLSPVPSSDVDASMSAEPGLVSRDVIEEDRLLDHAFDGEGLAPSAPPSPSPRPAPQLPPLAAAGVCPMPSAIDTIDVLIYGTLAGRRPVDAHADSVLQGILRMFHLATGVSFPVFGYAFTGGSTIAPTLTGQVTFTLGRGGRLTDVHLTATSLSGAVDSSLVATVRRADSAGEFGKSSTGEFTLSLSSATPPPGARAVPLTRIEVPAWRLAHGAAIDPDSAAPDLPPGSGTFEFVVDERGRAIPTTLQVIGETQRGFVVAVARSLSDFRFRPALIGQCPVKQVVRQPFSIHPTAVVR